MRGPGVEEEAQPAAAAAAAAFKGLPGLSGGSEALKAAARKKAGADGGAGEQNVLEALLRRIIAEEMDPVREDLRNDVTNLHTELIVSFARQSEEIKEMIESRDAAYQSLKEELKAVRAENRRLREYINTHNL